MTNALLTILVVLTAADLALNAASVLLHRFAPKSKATAEVDTIKKDVDEAESAVAKLAGKQSGRVSMTLVALLALVAVIAFSCTAAQKKAVSDFGHCEETAAVKDLEGPVKQIGDDFVAGTLTKDNALALLDSFAGAYGLDTVGCAVSLVTQLFSSKVSGSADTSKAVDLYNEWLGKHGAKQASADESFREAERNFAEVEKGIDDATAQINQMRAELAAASPCNGGVLSVDAYGRVSCASSLTGTTTGVMPGSYVPADIDCTTDNMPGSLPASDIPCNATITANAPTGKQ